MTTDIMADIFRKNGVELFALCRFERIAGRLLDNAARRRIPAGARSVVIAAFPYNTGRRPRNISRFAAVPDYHAVCGRILAECTAALRSACPGASAECFVDNSPVPEVYTAALCGLGVIGENGLLITEKYGSYVFLGEIVTDAAFDGTAYAEGNIRFCSKCGACRRGCLGGALSDSGFERERCLSRITQKKGALTAEEERLIASSGCVWGCDACQEACPMNIGVSTTPISAFREGYRDGYAPGEDIHGRAYEWRGERTILRNFDLTQGK